MFQTLTCTGILTRFSRNALAPFVLDPAEIAEAFVERPIVVLQSPVVQRHNLSEKFQKLNVATSLPMHTYCVCTHLLYESVGGSVGRGGPQW